MSGKRDRPAHFEIDQKTLQYKQNPQQNKETPRPKEDDIKQRKIYRIKTPGSEQHKEVQSSKPKFTLFTDHAKSQKKDQKKEQQQGKEHAIGNGKKEEVKPDQKHQAKEQQKEKEKDKDTSKQKSANPFLNFPTPIFSFSTEAAPKFGNGIGIFTNNEKNDGIFSKNNIFSNPGQGSTNPFFSNSASVFNFSAGVPPIKKQASGSGTKHAGEEDGEDGDSAELEKDQKEAADPSKSTGTYQYSAECELIFQRKILKFKRNDGDLLENTEVVVQHDKEKKTDWVIVRLCATKNPIVTGFLVPGKSEVKRMGNKDENIVLSILAIKDKHPQRNVLKIQFEKPQDGKEFRQAIQKILHSGQPHAEPKQTH